jgi:hypothetical protein
MKRPFGLLVGLALLMFLQGPASAQCFAAPRQAEYYQQPVQYYPSTSYYVGRVSMGTVYRAIDTALGREVAVKMLQDRFIRRSRLRLGD